MPWKIKNAFFIKVDNLDNSIHLYIHDRLYSISIMKENKSLWVVFSKKKHIKMMIRKQMFSFLVTNVFGLQKWVEIDYFCSIVPFFVDNVKLFTPEETHALNAKRQLNLSWTFFLCEMISFYDILLAMTKFKKDPKKIENASICLVT